MVEMIIKKKEVWKQIPGYKGRYSASTFGKIRRDAGGAGAVIGRILNPYKGKRGYYVVLLRKTRRSKDKLIDVHRLIARTLIGKVPKNLQINHKDGIKINNHISNLEYVTPSENIIHAMKNGLSISGEKHW